MQAHYTPQGVCNRCKATVTVEELLDGIACPYCTSEKELEALKKKIEERDKK
jgi:DNA-directed RNA polymerase subunit RPC12/RpoP